MSDGVSSSNPPALFKIKALNKNYLAELDNGASNCFINAETAQRAESAGITPGKCFIIVDTGGGEVCVTKTLKNLHFLGRW